VSRAQSVANTRARLLDAAAEVFADRGYEGASLLEIAQRAGFTRGAVYANFADKETIFLALLERMAHADLAETRQAIDATSTPEATIEAFRDTVERDPDVRRRQFLLLTEFRLAALRRPELAAPLAEVEARSRRIFGEALDAVLDRADGVPAAARGELVHIIAALQNGFEVLHLLDPDEVPADAFYDALSFLFAALVRSPAPDL
jgi:AcrR family transcriptional regulator